MVMDLKENDTFDILVGHMKWMDGTWSESSGDLHLSTTGENIGTTYHVVEKKLLPFSKKKEITTWRWVPK